MALPGDAARHARLGRGADADPDRRRNQRTAAQAARAGQPERPLLPARSRDRRAHPHLEVHRLGELGEGDQREGAADQESRKRCRRPWRAGVSRHERRDQLAAAQLQPRYRVDVLRHASNVQRDVSHRHRRPSAGMGRRRAERRQHRQRAESGGLQDRKSEVVASVRDGPRREPRRTGWSLEHGGRAPVRRRRRRQLHRLRRRHRQTALARRPWHEHEQRPADLPPRRPPVHRRRRGGLSVRVRAAAVTRTLDNWVIG